MSPLKNAGGDSRVNDVVGQVPEILRKTHVLRERHAPEAAQFPVVVKRERLDPRPKLCGHKLLKNLGQGQLGAIFLIAGRLID